MYDEKKLRKTQVIMFCAWISLLLARSILAGTELGTTKPAMHELSQQDGLAVLNNIIEGTKQNFAQIQSWKGRLYIEDWQRFAAPDDIASEAKDSDVPLADLDGGFQCVVKYDGEFAINQSSDAVFTTMAQTEPRGVFRLDGTRVLAGPSADYIQRSVVTPDGYQYFQPTLSYGAFLFSKGHGPQFGATAFREPKTKADNQTWSVVVDPRRILWPSRPLWEELQLAMSDIRSGSKVFTYRIYQSGDGPAAIYTIETYISQKLAKSIRYASAWNLYPTEWTDFHGDNPYLQLTWSYARVDGIVVPSVVKRTNFHASGGYAFIRAIVLSDQQLNIPIDKDSFTWKSLGLKENQRLVDQIEATAYVVHGGNLVDAQTLPLGTGVAPKFPTNFLSTVGQASTPSEQASNQSESSFPASPVTNPLLSSNGLILGSIGGGLILACCGLISVWYWRSNRNSTPDSN